MKRSAIYTRISSDREGAGLGVTRQEADCRELVERNGWTVLDVYRDNDLSAYSGKPRPDYRRLLDDIRSGAVDVVVTWHTDRLHRSPVELEEYIAACEPRGVPTVTVQAGPLDLATPSGRMVARQLGAVARYEVEHAIERMQRARLQAVTDGRWSGGRRPYGYEADGVTVREAEAEVVREAYRLVLAGSSLRSIAAEFNRRGLLTSTGRAFRQDTIRSLLLRPRNAGLMQHRGRVAGPANWPGLVSEDEWRAVCRVLTDPGRRTQITSARRWLLSGLARCGVCDGTLVVTLLASKRTNVAAYTCRERRCVVRQAVELDGFISAVVVERLSRPDAVTLLRPAAAGVDVVALHTRASALRERLDGLAAAYADASIDGQQLREGTARIRPQLQAVQTEIAEAAKGSVFSGVVDAPDVAAVWQALPLDRRRAVVDALMTVTIHPVRKGRPPGWRAGQSYFRTDGIDIAWKS